MGRKVDWAVIETGMGGRLDATNIIEPSISIISNLSIEHTTYLGNTIAQIAEEKGGIIKENTPVVTGVRQKNAVSILKKIAQDKSAPFYRFGEDFKVERTQEQRFNYFGVENVWRDMQTGLQGSYQVDNAALVLAACEILGRSEADLPLQCIKDGLEQNKWPGRLEIVSTSPFVVIDGAHNLD
ncbi:MAG: bifunctional folylpolyglutamate synthase/dihydrofolate synthase, partial [Deltaproteobacteria bacterium]|nr:bifunctional folylpolyglutamate synthase/dihydrofolate synthase [Deltaproteobacteria bacterium]